MGVIIVSLMNIVSVVICGGDSPNAPDFMKERFHSNEEICNVGLCGSRKIDCHFWFAFLIITGVTISYMMFRMYHQRQESTQEIREMTNVLVAERKKQHWNALSQHIASFSQMVADGARGAHTAVDNVVEGVESTVIVVKEKSRRMSDSASNHCQMQ